MSKPDLTVIGGGLAGSEAAWQAAESGLTVQLFEMRPQRTTGAHTSADLAELVCSNSLGSSSPTNASGLLMLELDKMGSLLLRLARASSVPAGNALAVDRGRFSALVSEAIGNHPRITITRTEITSLPDGLCIVATGPLTSNSFAQSLQGFLGRESLWFYDAIAPVITAESIDMGIAFRAARYAAGTAADQDYINCPLTETTYRAFVDALLHAERIDLQAVDMPVQKGVKAGQFFEGCLPVEILAARGQDTLAYGPMRPTGLKDPRTGQRPYAVTQLRQDNLVGSLYNMVGFQTNLKFHEQARIIRLIPGLEHAEIARYGQMHRNTYIASPELLSPTLQSRTRSDLLFAGQITGIEGYLGNIASGLLAGRNAVRLAHERDLVALPVNTMLGALCNYITHADMRDFQPMKANLGILPCPQEASACSKADRAAAKLQAAAAALTQFLQLNQ